jgi:phosphatidylglycerophosphate synthase
VRRTADVLTVVRLVLALALPFALVQGGPMSAVFWVIAAATDFFDGPLARRAGESARHGQLLDNGADIAFVLSGLATAAALGLVPWLVPAAILLAVVDYARASFEASRGMTAASQARSRVGHAAGVMNYACLGMVTARLAIPGSVPPLAMLVIELATVAANVGAVVTRALGRRGN